MTEPTTADIEAARREQILAYPKWTLLRIQQGGVFFRIGDGLGPTGRDSRPADVLRREVGWHNRPWGVEVLAVPADDNARLTAALADEQKRWSEVCEECGGARWSDHCGICEKHLRIEAEGERDRLRADLTRSEQLRHTVTALVATGRAVARRYRDGWTAGRSIWFKWTDTPEAWERAEEPMTPAEAAYLAELDSEEGT